MDEMNPLHELLQAGQSYWLDNLTRSMIRSGELERRVREEGLRGVTSNPAIFNKAISADEHYEEQIARLAAEGRSIQGIYEELVVRDIQDACDVLRPVWEDSGGVDGYVSLEVSPYLAHHTEATVDEACRLHDWVERPNVLIKIPGTAAGVPAIEECIYRGVSVNVTLLFSLSSYEAIALAYVRGLERRRDDGRRLDDVTSLASFFLSRIDSLADQLVGQRISPEGRAEPRPERLLGKAAVANAKLAYRRFRELTATDRWLALAADGARVQRMLWASTSTKNPLYGDVRYVEPLIGPETVNTLPDETIAAFADHGRVSVSVSDGLEDAERTVDDLGKAGIDFGRVTWQLENEGVQKFIEPFDKLMATIADRTRRAHRGALASGRAALAGAEATVNQNLAALQGVQFGRRIWARDASLWPVREESDAEAIHGRLGWLDSTGHFCGRLPELLEFAAAARAEQIRSVVLLGMGGSSLAAEVAQRTFGSQPGWPRLRVLDNTDPDSVRGIEQSLDLDATLFLVASKSGTTLETMSFYRYFRERIAERTDTPGRRFIAITDPSTPLAEEAAAGGFRACFENPPDIGGRYSALSYFGLVPMALAGFPVEEMLRRASMMQSLCGPFVPASHNPGVQLGTVLAVLAKRGHDKVTFVASGAFRSFGLWAEQLLAESTGKEGRGIVPIADEPPGSPSEYGSDRVFVWLGLEEEAAAASAALEPLEASHPVLQFTAPDRTALGGEFYRWEMAVATAGALLRINPFDQPDVEASKQQTREVLAAWAGEARGSDSNGQAGRGIGPGEEPFSVLWGGDGTGESLKRSADEVLDAIADLVGPGDYIAILPYFAETPRRDNALSALRNRLRARLGVATTVGYGPRYLHSTGQLHKGGPESGIFLLLTASPVPELEIPGQEVGFGRLILAQALGDLRTLSARGRRVARIHLGSDVDGGLERLTAGP
jgi:transaldolase/glucose-6-phosphate isomerase